MATKRARDNGTWQYIVKRKGLLPKPLYLTFDNEDEGDRYAAALEAQLDAGVLPSALSEKEEQFVLVGNVIHAYLAANQVPASDRQCLEVVYSRIGGSKVANISYKWVEDWVSGMKRVHHLAPSTIRHHVGALARCFDWASRRKVTALLINPIRMLPRRYATYNEADAKILLADGVTPPVDEERDRRLSADEERNIRNVLDKQKPEDKQRAFELEFQAALELIFDLALETAMRMREMFTLDKSQVDLAQRTIFLDKTKNGDKRQVPLSTIIVRKIKRYLTQVARRQRGMEGFNFAGERLLPWWDGNKAALDKTTSLLSQQFARIFEEAGCADLRFHDLRHEATSRLYERTKLSDLEIAKITGHKDLRMLRRYANLRGSNLATQLW
jgi:integrase